MSAEATEAQATDREADAASIIALGMSQPSAQSPSQYPPLSASPYAGLQGVEGATDSNALAAMAAAVQAAGGDAARAFGAITAQVAEKLKAFNATAGGSSRKVGRFRMLTSPPSLDAGEITDKGYVNQRATQDARAADVASLFASEAGPGVEQL